MDLEIIQRGLINLMKRNKEVTWNEYIYKPKIKKEEINWEKEIRLINKEAISEWQKRWEDDEHGRITFQLIKDVTFTQSNQWFKPSRECTQILTGYGSINSTLFQRGAAPEVGCPVCGKEETVEHMLQECIGYEEHRYELIKLKGGQFSKLIENKDAYTQLVIYINNVFEIRKAHLKLLNEDESSYAG
jgi:hypothetical protein